MARGSGRYRPARVGDRRQPDKHQPERHHLQRYAPAGRIHELREERKEKECSVRVQHIDDDTLPEDAVQIIRALVCDVDRLAVSIEKRPNAENDQVHGAQPSHDVERERRGHEQRRQAKCRGRNVHERTSADAKHRDEAGTTATANAARHDVQHRRPRRHQQREGRADEQAGVRQIWHPASISSPSTSLRSQRCSVAKAGHEPVFRQITRVNGITPE